MIPILAHTDSGIAINLSATKGVDIFGDIVHGKHENLLVVYSQDEKTRITIVLKNPTLVVKDFSEIIVHEGFDLFKESKPPGLDN